MASAPNGGDSQAPSAATNLTVTDRTSSTLSVTWDAASDAGSSGLVRYAVTVDGRVEQTVDAATTSTTVSGLSADTSYDVGVTAFDGANNESNTVVVAATTDSADSDGSGTGSGGDTGSGTGSGSGSGSGSASDSDSGSSGGWWGSGGDSGSGSGGDTGGWWDTGGDGSSDDSDSGGWW